MNEKIKSYPKTELSEVIDTMGVPHPFCIGSKHVAHASDHFSGMLGDYAIRDLEKKLKRPNCEVKGCNLMYDEHKQALAIGCKSDDKEKLREYLLSIKDKCEADGFAGFVFVDQFSNKSEDETEERRRLG